MNTARIKYLGSGYVLVINWNLLRIHTDGDVYGDIEYNGNSWNFKYCTESKKIYAAYITPMLEMITEEFLPEEVIDLLKENANIYWKENRLLNLLGVDE
jgi:hypothetical protein